MAQYLSNEDYSRIDQLAENSIESKSLDTEHLGVNVGRVALYELTLAHKKMSTVLSALQWSEYRCYLTNALRTLQGFAHYLEKNTHDAILCFSPQYSNNNSAMQYAINMGVKVLFLESGTNIAHRLGTMRVWDWKVHKLVNPGLTYWRGSELSQVTPYSARMVTRHFRQLINGQHFAVYSTPHKECGLVRKRWNIRQEQKIILMTLSSYDEAYAALLIEGFPAKKVFSKVFRTQAEWIKATTEWMETRPDLFLVIRVHPRDFPNKRDALRSEQSYILEDLLKHTPDNVYVNWPEENISLYDILEDVEAVLTGWSVTAMEALVLGIPVVTYDAELPSYPSDIHYTGNSKREYFLNIDRALTDGWRLENAINGFRWLAYSFVTCTITVSETFGSFEFRRQFWLNRFIRRISRRFKPLYYMLDLLDWKAARPGALNISDMLMMGYDALPQARITYGTPNQNDDRDIILEELSCLHKLIFSGERFATDRRGLSANILKELNKWRQI